MKKGFTLVEVLVAMGLFSIVIVIAVGGFANALHAQREVAALVATQSNASLALEEIAREVRTGYFFCYAPNAPPSTGYTWTCSSSCGPPLSPPWTCLDLHFNAADGTNVDYILSNGVLQKSENGVIQPVTSDNVAVKNLTFTLFGNLDGDSWDPRITISMGVAPSSTDPVLANNVLNLQTTVSARDCGNRIGDC